MVCVRKGGNTNKANGMMSEKRRDTATVHTTTARAECVKGHKTYTKKIDTHAHTANMHRQWKLTVRTEWYGHGTAHRPATAQHAVCSHAVVWRFTVSLLQPHTETRTADFDVR